MAAASEQLDNPLIDDLEEKVNNFESQFKDKISQIEQKLSPVQNDDQQIAEIGEVDTSIGEVNTRLKNKIRNSLLRTKPSLISTILLYGSCLTSLQEKN